MVDFRVIPYEIKDPLELNLAFIPFIMGGGLFIPSFDSYALGELLSVDLQLPGKVEVLRIEGKVVWITPSNALHHVLPGIGIQFIGSNAQSVKSKIEAHLDKSMQAGGYTYGIIDETKKEK
ncbi:MAG: PilZ domain-containing protein [Gammaproteobacteria bacterium]|nr:PilZ domain-containing protein [Gammaproteobacteria bacterium]